MRNYVSPVDGLCATALTLILPAYSGILGALQGGQLSAVKIVETYGAEFDTWGSGAALVLSVLEAA